MTYGVLFGILNPFLVVSPILGKKLIILVLSVQSMFLLVQKEICPRNCLCLKYRSYELFMEKQRVGLHRNFEGFCNGFCAVRNTVISQNYWHEKSSVNSNYANNNNNELFNRCKRLSCCVAPVWLNLFSSCF